MRSGSKSTFPLKCVVVDDEAGAVSILSGYIKKTPGLELVNTFRDPVEALNFLSRGDADVVFLDIDMPELNGLQLSGLIRDSGILVIFCTAHPQYAAESYEKEAVDYLLKPVSFDRFLKSVKRLESESSPRSLYLDEKILPKSKAVFIKSGITIHRVDPDDILFLEKEGHYFILHTRKDKIITRMSMKDIFAILPPDGFVQVHKSWVVAIDKIDRVIKHEVVVAGNEIPIGDHYRLEFFKTIRIEGR